MSDHALPGLHFNRHAPRRPQVAGSTELAQHGSAGSPNSPEDFIRKRCASYRTWARAYDHGASVLNDVNRRLSVLTAGLSAVVSSAIFASLSTAGNTSTTVKWVAAGISLAATAVAAMVVSLGYGDTATKYREAAMACVKLCTRAEEMLAKGSVTPAELAEYDESAMEAQKGMPIVRDGFYRWAERQPGE